MIQIYTYIIKLFIFLADTSQTNEMQRFSECTCNSATSMTKGVGLPSVTCGLRLHHALANPQLQ